MKCDQGVIPVLAIVAIIILSALGGASVMAYFSGSAKTTILLFIFGIVCGLILLPNLKNIIRWYKDVKKEL